MWIWVLSRSSGGNVGSLIARAHRYGISTLMIKSGDGASAWSQFSRQLVSSLHAGGLRVCAWQYVYGVHPVGEARVGAAAVAKGEAKQGPGGKRPEDQKDPFEPNPLAGDGSGKFGDKAGALQAYRADLAISKRLVAADPDSAEWQNDLGISHGRIGDMLLGQGNSTEALNEYEAKRAINERLTKTDPDNAQWHRGLATALIKIGDVQMAERNAAEALTLFQAGRAIRERLARTDPTNVQWQLDLVIENWRLAVKGDEPAARWAFMAASLRALKEQNKLAAEPTRWLAEAEAHLPSEPELAGARR